MILEVGLLGLGVAAGWFASAAQEMRRESAKLIAKREQLELELATMAIAGNKPPPKGGVGFDPNQWQIVQQPYLPITFNDVSASNDNS